MFQPVYNLYTNVWQKYRTDEEIAGIIPYNNVFKDSLGPLKLALLSHIIMFLKLVSGP